MKLVCYDTPFICKKKAVGFLRGLLVQKIQFHEKMLPNLLRRWVLKSRSHVGNMVHIYKLDHHRLVGLRCKKPTNTFSVSLTFLADALQWISRRQVSLLFCVKFFLGPSKTLRNWIVYRRMPPPLSLSPSSPLQFIFPHSLHRMEFQVDAKSESFPYPLGQNTLHLVPFLKTIPCT